ncbi:GGDEF domain-containing protein [Shewanella waksmanii]|uniref:GGDEF domain-containing protein n=1 Tax=Shewanella waksmanii TaxID=213783 RepID=UPI003735C584
MLKLTSFIFLLSLISMSAHSLEKVDILLDEAELNRSSDPSTYKDVLNKLDKLQREFTPLQSYKYKYYRAYQFAIKGDVKSAINLYEEVFYGVADISLKVKAGYSIFNLYAVERDFIKAISMHNEVMPLYASVTDASVKYSVMLASMVLFYELETYEKVLQYLEPDLNAKSSLKCKYHTMRVRARYKVSTLDFKRQDFEDVISLCNNSREPLFETLVRLDLLRFLLDTGHLRQAKLEGLKNLQTADSSQFSLVIQEYYYLLAKIHWELGEKSLALEFASQANQVGRGNKFSLPQTLTYQLLYQIEKQKGNFEQALFYAEKYAEADKAYLDEVQAKALAVKMAEAEVIEKNRRIEALAQQNQLLKLEQKVDIQAQENNRLIITVMLLLILFISVWAYRTKMVQKELKRLSQFDYLTKVFNRRHFTFLGEQALQLAARKQQPISVIMLDLDYFKQINDRYGHSIGDKVLVKAASELKQLTRKSDVFGRLGGEEFALVLPDCSQHQAAVFAERCREQLARIAFVSESGEPFQVTASFGVTDAQLSGFNLTKLLCDADTALYSAKGASRNQVSEFSLQMRTEPENEKDITTHTRG